MSEATLVNGKRRNGRAIHDGKQVETIDEASQGSDVATTSIAPSESVPSQPESSQASQEVPAVRTLEQLVADYEASLDRTAKSIGRLMDGTKLAVYCEVGEECDAHLHLAKLVYDTQASERKVASEWSETLYDNECAKLSLRVRALFPHLFLAEKESSDEDEAKGRKRRDPIRVQDYVLTTRGVRVVRPIVGDCIDNLSYRLCSNYLFRKVVSLSKAKLTCTLKKDWAEFTRTEVPRVANGQISVGEFIAQLNAHEGKLSDAREEAKNAGKSPADIAKAQKDAAQRKAIQEKTRKSAKLNESLTTSLFDALSGVMEPSKVQDIIVKACEDTGVSLPCLNPPDRTIDPSTITADELLDTLRTMMLLKRMDEVRAVCTACAEMVAIFPALAPKPLAIANAG